jgi:subtilisin family serine protease
VGINDTWIVNNQINNDALNLLNAQCAWTITTGSPDIIVGVIDTEFETTHEDLQNTFAGTVGTRSDPLDHGTSVSSCVATGTNNNKGIAGIGYNTRVKGYYTNGSGSTLWNTIWQAYQDDIKIINVSWTGIGSFPNTLAVREMTNNGVVLIVAAGNDPNSTSHRRYADFPGVINVSGVWANNQHAGTNHAQNQWVDVCALSKNVAACVAGDTYSTVNGTSFAAPQVAGVVALLRSMDSNLSPAEIENIIKSTTDPIADAHLFPGLLGTGRVNAYAAVLAVCAATTPPVNFLNRTVTSHTTVTTCSDINVQNVTVQNGAALTLSASGHVSVNGTFDVRLGSTLNVQ